MKEQRITTDRFDSAISNLLNNSYGLARDQNFLDDFPVWDPKLNASSHRFASFEGDQIVGFAGLRICNLKVNESLIPIGLIGGVSTDLKHRKKGIASRLTNIACDYASQCGASAVFLWGSEFDLYRKLGFELCGTQLRISIGSLPKTTGETSKIETGFTPKILEAAKKREWGVEIKPSDHSWYTQHKNVDWIWAQHGNQFAYVGINRGIDLQNFVHEMGGDPELLRSILWIEGQKNPNLQIIGNPEIFSYFGLNADQAVNEYVCMARVLDPNKIFEKLELRDLRAEKTQGDWLFSYKSQTLGALGPSGIVGLLFGPDKIDGLPAELKSHFPLPIWFWGLDSA